MPQAICGVVMRSVRNENGTGGSSPGCISSPAQSMVRPSSRGGVPVLSRPSAQAQPVERLGQPDRRRLADRGRPGSLRSPMWITPRRKVPVVSTTAPARNRARRRPVDHAGDAAVLDDQILDRRLDHGRGSAVGAGAACIACAVELAVGLGARAPHRRPLAAVEQAELDAGGVGDPAHQAVERVDLAHQVALAEPADRRVARHLADGRDAVGEQQRARAHARRRRRGLAAGMAAADHDDVEDACI